MYIHYIHDRRKLGYQVLDDTACGNHLVMRIDSIVTNLSPMEVESCYVYSFKLKNKVKKTIAIIVLGTTFWIGTPQPSEAMGLSIPPRSTPVGRVQPSYQHPAELKIAPIVDKRLDKIYFMPNKEMIPLIYLNAQNVYINEKVLKRLRAGGFEETLVLMAIGLVVFLTFQLSGADAFAVFDQFGKFNAPTTGGPRYDGITSAYSTGIAPHMRMRSTALQAYGPSHTQASTFNNPDGSMNLDKAYREVLRRARFSENFTCSFDRFVDLASEGEEPTNDSVRTAISALQLEADGIVSNVRRDPSAIRNGVKSFDCLADGPNGETHLEIKGPVGSEIRKAAGLGPSIPKQGKKIGYKIKNQINYWLNPENTNRSKVTLPEDKSKILVVTDLFDVPVSEKEQMRSSIEVSLNNAHPILFINHRVNR